MFYTIQNEYLTARICTTGAELHSLKDNITGYEYIWQGDPAVWSGHAPILFPIVGRLKNDTFTHNGKQYTLAKHGFARKNKFTIGLCADDFVTLSLHSGAFKESYPFDCTLEITYELTGRTLKVTHRVTNHGETDMYFSLGAHPAFNCSVGDFIGFPADQTARAYRLRSDCGLLTDEKITEGIKDHHFAITPDAFAQDALIFEGLRSDRVILYCSNIPRVIVDYGNAPCLGIWAKPNAPYVCIEPWYGMDDSASVSGELANKPQIVKLPAKNCFRFPMSITTR